MKKLFFINIFLLLLQLKTYELQIDKRMPIENYYEYLEFSEQNLYEYILLLGFKDPFFIYKQAIWESGWFNAPLYKRTNNLFGLHKAMKRKTTADYWIYADKGLYSGYYHWTKSVQDRKLYENWLLKTYPDMEYKSALMKAGYCPNRQYIKNVEKIKTRIKRL